jgi:hypothetical protein
MANVYLKLFHGFPNAQARIDADDWGANGDSIGPLKWVHVTYGDHITFEFLDQETRNKYTEKINVFADMLGEFWLHDSDDGECIKYGDMEYGDWEVVAE